MKKIVLLFTVFLTVGWIIYLSVSIQVYSHPNKQVHEISERIEFQFLLDTTDLTYINELDIKREEEEKVKRVANDVDKDKLEINQMKKNNKKIIISLAGDFTLGTDMDYGYQDSFIHEVERQKKDYNYFVKNFKFYFEGDDLSLVNLETTLTNATKKAVKKFRFKGSPELAQILELASVEAVNIANNHTYDYLEEGFYDTIKSLEQSNIGYFGYNYKLIKNIDGVKVGVLGYQGWEFTDKLKEELEKELDYLKQYADIIVVSFHWGNQNFYYPDDSQIKIAHYAVDQGANLVFGHHPHVIQGIEKYNGSHIVYSLGNFLYGGHRNPADKDTFIFQQSFYFDKQKNKVTNGEIKVIPFSISSVDYRNNYQPTPLENEEKEKFYERINTYSSIFDKYQLDLGQ